MIHEIIYPDSPLYYVASTGNVVAHGRVEKDQVVTTGLETIETFTNKIDYLSKLEEFGVQSEEDIV